MVRIGGGHRIVALAGVLVVVQVQRVLDGRRVPDPAPDIVERLCTSPLAVGGEQGVAQREDAEETEVDAQFPRHIQVDVHLGVEPVVVRRIADFVDVALVDEPQVPAVEDPVSAPADRNIALMVVPGILEYQVLVVHIGISPVERIAPGVRGEGFLRKPRRVTRRFTRPVVQADVFHTVHPLGHQADDIDATLVAGIDFPGVVQAAEGADIDHPPGGFRTETGLVHDVGYDGDGLDLLRVQRKFRSMGDDDVVDDVGSYGEAPDLKADVGRAELNARRTGILGDEQPRDDARKGVLDIYARVFLDCLARP